MANIKEPGFFGKYSEGNILMSLPRWCRRGHCGGLMVICDLLFIECVVVPGTVLNALHTYSQLIIILTLTDGETEAQR